AVNRGLHVAAVLLVLACLRRLLPERAAFAAAAIFAIHPAVSEAVLYIWARSTLLATVFCLAAWRSWLDGRRWIAVAWFAAALISKEECAAFPLMLLLFGRTGVPACPWTGREACPTKPIAAMAALVGMAAARLIYAVAVTPGAPIAQAAGVGPLDYLLAEGAVVLRYLRLVVVPWGFTMDPDGRVTSVGLALAAWAALGGLIAIAVRRRH